MCTVKELAIRILGVAISKVGNESGQHVYGCHAISSAIRTIAHVDGHMESADDESGEVFLHKEWSYSLGRYLYPDWAQDYAAAHALVKSEYRQAAVTLFGDIHQGTGDELGTPWFWDKGRCDLTRINAHLLAAGIDCRKAAMQSAIRTLKGQA